MGIYPINTTGQQFHFDVDGTVGQLLASNRSYTSTISSASLSLLTNWAGGGTYSNYQITQYFNLYFPQARDLSAFSMMWNWSGRAPTSFGFWVSYDTTDGINGTWTQIRTAAELEVWRGITTRQLRSVEPFSFAAVRGFELRVAMNSGQNDTFLLYALNLFGDYSPAGLRFWHATEDREMDGNNLDFGDVSRNNSYTREFRIKNLNTLTANNVLIAAAAPNSGSTLAGMEFSDGGAYAVSQTISSIAPSAISSVITARRTVASNATENQIGNCRITATEGSWS